MVIVLVTNPFPDFGISVSLLKERNEKLLESFYKTTLNKN